jgi:hypothetical protein
MRLVGLLFGKLHILRRYACKFALDAVATPFETQAFQCLDTGESHRRLLSL